ncbi:hypothetical protein L1987_60145 [Smallanthus sonchifolius]|uniref:Uncharacterized protein n=1 Tax=Smallanthus sonchifolius TaxID=185202 RepID=A0ACB9D7B5_9ASTR|nr:hypothetical protein L1987_60145 [Smallanthus sonchifolius]
MEIQMARLGRPSGKDAIYVSQAYPVYDGCSEIGHTFADCPREQGKSEEVNQLGSERRQQDMNATHYHPGLRNHPNLRYGNASNQLNPNFQGSNVQGGGQPHHQQYQNLQQGYNQGRYQRNQGNQGYQQGGQHGYQTNYQQQNQKSGTEGGDALGDSQFNALMDAIKELKRDNEVRDKMVNALAKQVGLLAEDLSRRDLGKLPSNTQTNPKHQGLSSNYAYVGAVRICNDSEEIDLEDDSEQGAPFIPVEVGGIKVNQTLLYYGATLSILPGSQYDQSDLGHPQQVDTTVVLADLT